MESKDLKNEGIKRFESIKCGPQFGSSGNIDVDCDGVEEYIVADIFAKKSNKGDKFGIREDKENRVHKKRKGTEEREEREERR